MKAGEWLYLCVAHGNNVGGHVQCCAIDYIVHTLDSATALLNSTRVFPSRLSVPPSSYRHFSSLARRLSRIFAHAFYHHRELFSHAEAESSLYARFLALSQQHSLVPPELLVIPLEGLDPNHSDERMDPPDEYERNPGSPQSAIEPGEGTFIPNPAHERPVPQSRQLFDDGSTGEDAHDSNEDLEEPDLPEEPASEELEPGEESEHGDHDSIEPSVEVVTENAGSTEQHEETQDSNDFDGTATGHSVKEVPEEPELGTASEQSNGETKPAEDTTESPSEQPEDARSASPHENGAPTHESEPAPKEDLEPNKEA
ncbi:hypothetical protein FRC09_005330 [Ceratobasidium sp. 395]|nr:hypothetical protein FRC09_005330 [Ceratobasidium sp. 395]